LTKKLLIKRTSAIFLAIVLITGTIALSIPSFMIGTAQALPYYGQDNNYDKKSDAKNISVKSIKCNNVNVNVNGLELNGLPPFLTGLASEAQATDNEGQYGASSYGSYGSGEQSWYDNNSFKFVCINNNNNTVVFVNETTTPEPLTCVECFESSFTRAEIIALETGFGGTLEQECDNAADVGVFESDVENRIEEILGPIEEERFNNLVECLIEAGIVIFPGTAPPPNG
jgi:hypothetical protein